MGDITALYIEKARIELMKDLGEKVTDYKIAKILGVPNGTISKYLKTERECEDDNLIVKIAQIANVPPFEIMAKIHAAKATTPEAKGIWEKLLNSPIVKASSKDCILCSIQNFSRLPIIPAYKRNNTFFRTGIAA